MNKIIKLYDISTYPKDIFNNNNNICNIDIDNYYIMCVHVTRTYNISAIKNNGLLRPLIVNKETKEYYVSKCLENIILKPFEDLENFDFDELKIKYENRVKDSFEKVYNVEDYYGRYSVIHFTFENFDTVNSRNAGSNNFKKCYGGELFDEDDYKLVKNKTKPYAIFFKVKISELTNVNKGIIIDSMVDIYNNKVPKSFPTGYITRDINSNEIIAIKELIDYD